jgi:hypothetical protein
VIEAPAGEPDPTTPVVHDDGSTQDRRQAAGGATVNEPGGPTEDPRLVGLKEGQRVMEEEGGSRERAMGTAFDVIGKAASEGDERATWNPQRDDPRRGMVESEW